MAIYPKALVKLLPENATQPRITPTQVIVHTAVDGKNTTSLYDWFDKPSNLESHFYVRADGTVEQYMDTNVRADANNKSNSRAVSIETHDGWASTGKPGAVTTPWTPAQVASLIDLVGWICTNHGIPKTLAPAWDRPGIGWHNMNAEWSVGGTGCPGPTRTAQFRDVIIPALAGVNVPTEQEDDMTPEQDAVLRDIQAWVKNLARATGADNPDIPGIIDFARDTNTWVKLGRSADGTYNSSALADAIKGLPPEVVAAIKEAL